MSELKPCPFCGGEARYKEVYPFGSLPSGWEIPKLTVGCKECNIWIKAVEQVNLEKVSKMIDVKPELSKTWNTRRNRPLKKRRG